MYSEFRERRTSDLPLETDEQIARGCYDLAGLNYVIGDNRTDRQSLRDPHGYEHEGSTFVDSFRPAGIV